MGKPQDLGWLKRVDKGNGRSDLLDAWGNPVLEVRTEALDAEGMKNYGVRRFKVDFSGDVQ